MNPSLTDKNIEEYINNFEKDLNEIINVIISNSGENIDRKKEQLIEKVKNIMNNYLNKINELQNEKIQIQKKFDKYKSNLEKNKHFLENRLKENYKQLNTKVKQIKIKNKEISKLNEELKNLKQQFDIDINNQKNENENLSINYEILEKKYKKLKGEISELKDLNIKYGERISELEKENDRLNDLLIENQNNIKNNSIKYKKKLDEMQNEIIDLKNELDEKEQDLQEYKNKYEKELKNSKKLEQKIQNLLSNKESNLDYITENEPKKKKIPKRIRERNVNTFSDIEQVEKKFRYLYKTTESLNYRNQSKNSHNSAISNIENNNNLTDSYNKNKKEVSEFKTEIYRSKNSTGFKQLLNIYKNSNKKEENNNSKEILDDNSTNINSNSSIKLSPENYSFIKLYQLNNKLKWCLFKKNKKSKSHTKRYSMGNDLANSDMDIYDYSDFIWLPYKTRKDFPEFREISSFADSYELKDDKKEEIEDLKLNIKNLENIISEKNKENNKLNNELYNLTIENQRYKSYNDKLKEENYKMKCESKPDKNFIGVSFIDDDPENSKFLDDKCCEDILKGLDKNPNRNNQKKNSCYSDKLKNSIDMLMTKIIPNEDVNFLMANILSQLGCSNEDIYKLIGNHRGVISIPYNKNK